MHASLSQMLCFCAGQKAAESSHVKSKHKTERRLTKRSGTADDRSVAASTAHAPVKSKGKAQNATHKSKRGKSAGRVGLINPTTEEIKTAFSMFNPHNRSVITAQDIARVGQLLHQLSGSRQYGCTRCTLSNVW